MTKIIVNTTIFAPIEIVWDYYTHSKHIQKWYIFSQGWKCKKVDMEFCSGGKYFAEMQSVDGSTNFDVKAIFDNIQNFKNISYTLSDGRKVNTFFDDLDGAVKITTSFDSSSKKDYNSQQNEWIAILNNFKNYVEKRNT